MKTTRHNLLPVKWPHTQIDRYQAAINYAIQFVRFLASEKATPNDKDAVSFVKTINRIKNGASAGVVQENFIGNKCPYCKNLHDSRVGCPEYANTGGVE